MWVLFWTQYPTGICVPILDLSSCTKFAYYLDHLVFVYPIWISVVTWNLRTFLDSISRWNLCTHFGLQQLQEICVPFGPGICVPILDFSSCAHLVYLFGLNILLKFVYLCWISVVALNLSSYVNAIIAWDLCTFLDFNSCEICVPFLDFNSFLKFVYLLWISIVAWDLCTFFRFQ